MTNEKTPNTKKNKAAWNKAQIIGLWFIIITSVSFWSGVYLGQMQMTLSNNNVDAAKTQAVEDYKATLKAEQ